MSLPDPASVLQPVTLRLRSGEPVTLRLLRDDDAGRLGAYLIGLSETTRSLWAPHPFDQPTADALCAAVASDRTLRLLVTTGRDEDERVIGYFLLMLGVLESDAKRYADLELPLHDATDCTLAPSVADAYQDQGVGSLAVGHLIRAAGALGRKRMVLWGGVQERNVRARHFYEKHGFRKVGEFYTKLNNHDMILDLFGRPD